jgi:hypothetical protein
MRKRKAGDAVDEPVHHSKHRTLQTDDVAVYGAAGPIGVQPSANINVPLGAADASASGVPSQKHRHRNRTWKSKQERNTQRIRKELEEGGEDESGKEFTTRNAFSHRLRKLRKLADAVRKLPKQGSLPDGTTKAVMHMVTDNTVVDAIMSKVR